MERRAARRKSRRMKMTGKEVRQVEIKQGKSSLSSGEIMVKEREENDSKKEGKKSR